MSAPSSPSNEGVNGVRLTRRTTCVLSDASPASYLTHHLRLTRRTKTKRSEI